MFYVIGHFSKFVPEGSVRIDVAISNSMIETVGFKRPDGNIALILYNQYLLPIEVTVVVDTNREFVLNIPPNFIQSVVYHSNFL